jgi:probable F420-dependent oxidoreductase
MRAGIVTPVASLNPRFAQPWEYGAGIEEIVAIAQNAERLGYHHVTSSEHIAIAADKTDLRGGSYWDGLATLSYIAAHTSRIRLEPHVIVLGLQHPLAVVKRWGTLDRMSGGRVVLGVGVGSAKEEFELLGQPFEGRGARADDAIRAIRASFGRREPSYSGSSYQFDGWVVEPHGIQTDLDIWVGGRSERALRRAIELGDGWAPQGSKHERLAEQLDRAQATEAYRSRSKPFEVLLSTDPSIDPSKEPHALADAIGNLAKLGATMLNVRTPHHSLEHCLEQFEAYAEVAASTGLVEFASSVEPSIR